MREGRAQQLPDDPEERRLYAESLGDSVDHSSVGVLARLLRDRDVDVRLAAVESLQSIGRKGADSGDIRISEGCAMALTTALADENAHIRWRAAKALGGLAAKEAVFPLLRLLRDENKHVAWAAADALEAIGDPSTLREVEKFKESRYRIGG